MLKTPNGIVRKTVNSYSKHFSITNNRRYNSVLRWTWDGYKLFSTVALCLYLLQGPWEQQILAFAILPLEIVPQFLICVMNVTHWAGPYQR